jgi:hypothetical protein
VRERLGYEPCALAYPYGFHDDATRAAARAAGFSFACGTRRGVADLDAGDPLALPRLRVRGYRWVHVLQFRMRMRKVLGVGRADPG